MSLIDNIPGVSDFLLKVKEAIFGENNSRIDMILDFFFNLRQEKRAKIVFYSIFGISLSMIVVMILYFWGLHRLQSQLDNAASDLKTLNIIQPNYMAVNNEFNQLLDQLRINNQYSTIVSKLDQKSKDLDVDTSTIPEKPALIELPGSNPMAGQFQKIKIDYKLNNVSLKKIIDYVTEIQKMPNHFKVSNLEIQQKFGTKLYFDVNITVEAFVSSAK
jgi:hypothetical protein